MEIPVMANRQVGLSHSEASCSGRWVPGSPYAFLYPRQPVFAVPANVKIRKNLRKFGRMRVKPEEKDCQAEKDLGFKPSFGEYLKVMETVKTRRERKTLTDRLKDGELGRDVNLLTVEKDEAGFVGAGGGNGNFKRFRGFSGGQDMASSSKSSFRPTDKLRNSHGSDFPDAAVDDGKLDHEMKIIRRGNGMSSNTQFNVKVERKIGGRTMDDSDSRMNEELGKSKLVKIDKMHNVEVVVGDVNGDSSNITIEERHGTRESSPGIWVRERNAFKGKEVGVRSRTSNYKPEVNLNQVSSNITIEERDSTRESSPGIWVRKRNAFEGKEVSVRPQTSSYKTAVNFNQVKETTPGGSVQKNRVLLEKKQLYHGGDNDSKVGRVAFKPLRDSDYVGVRPRTSSYKPAVNFNQIKESIPGESVQENRMLIEKKRLYRGGDNNLKVERTAFKPLENSDYVGVRPRTSSYKPAVNFNQVRESTPGESVQKNRMLLEKKRLYHGGDNDSKVERAAFKTLEDPDYVVCRIPASKRETEDRIQKLAYCLNGADIDMPEWMFSKMVRSAKIKYTDHNVLRIIQILGKLGNWRRVLQVIEWLQIRDRFKSHNPRFIYTTALHVLGKAGRPVEALNLFHTMQKRVSIYPDLVAYHSIAVTLGQAGYMKELFDVIDSMRSPPKKKNKEGFLANWDPSLEPDVVIYNAVLNACVRRKQWEGAFWVLQQLKEQNQKPSAATYGLVMEVMFVCEKYNLVHEFFHKSQKASIPNALVYRVLVNTLSKEGNTDEAVLAVQQMESRGIVGSASLYYDLARCLCRAGRCEKALTQVEKICRVANKPLVVTYTGLIQACFESEQASSAAYIFNHMKQFCSPNLVTCNIMLKGYLDHGLFEEAISLFDTMLDDSKRIGSRLDYKVLVAPDIYTFNTMLEACVTKQRWDDFSRVYETMLEHGHHFNSKRHTRMILEAARAGKEEPVEITWKHLARAGRVPPTPVVKQRFCSMLEKCDYNSALECAAAANREEAQAFNTTSWSNLLKANSHRFTRETIVQLVQNSEMLVSENNAPLQNLLTACDDFLRKKV